MENRKKVGIYVGKMENFGLKEGEIGLPRFGLERLEIGEENLRILEGDGGFVCFVGKYGRFGG